MPSKNLVQIEAQFPEGIPPGERAEFARLVQLAEEEINAQMGDLPPPLQSAVEKVLVLLQDFPNPEQEEEGVEPDQLGLFEGIGVEDPASPQLPRITLWLGNLWEMSDGQAEAYREEVRITFLHELGHYLGLGEEELEERDLG